MNALDAFFWRAAERGSALIRDTARGFDGGDREGHLVRACYGADGVAEHVFDDVRLVIEDEWTARLVAEGIAVASALRYSRPDYAAMMDEAAAEKPSLAPPTALRTRLIHNVVSALVWRTVSEIRPCLIGEARPDDGYKLVHAIPDRVVDSLQLLFGDDLMVCQSLGASIMHEATDYVFREGAPTRHASEPVQAPNIADIGTRAAIALADRMAAAEGTFETKPEASGAWADEAPSARLCAVLELTHADAGVCLQIARSLQLMAAQRAVRRLAPSQPPAPGEERE